MAVSLSGNALVLIYVVALRRARLVLGWVTVRGYTTLVFNKATLVVVSCIGLPLQAYLSISFSYSWVASRN